MQVKPGRMTSEEFRAALAIVDETPASFAELLESLGHGGDHLARTVQRWASGKLDIPGPVQALLQLLVLMIDETSITPADVRRWLVDAVEGAPATENDAIP